MLMAFLDSDKRVKLQGLINEYVNFTKCEEYDEQNKFEFFTSANKQLSGLNGDNCTRFLSEIKTSAYGDKSFTFFMNALVMVAKENQTQFWLELFNLYKDDLELGNRVNRFEKYAAPLIKKWTKWGKADLRNISLLLAIHNCKVYPIYKSRELKGIGGKNPREGFLQKVGLLKMKFQDVGQSYVGGGYSTFFALCTEILNEMKKYPELASSDMLTVQDFIHVVGTGFYGREM